MFYVASEAIAADHRELEQAVLALDDFLRKNGGYQVRFDHAADILHIERGQLRRLLGLYEARGVVKQENAYICDECDGFLAHVPGEGGLWCDVCEKSFSFRGRGSFGEKVWRVLPEAAQTGWQPSAEDAAVNTSPGTAPGQLVIQFVAGDRGGGPRAQLQIPREEKAIKDAIDRGRCRDAFDFAASVYAASLNDVIACHRARPTIMHFVGHGEERRMVLVRDRDLVVDMVQLDPGHVETLFGNFSTRVRLVVFNTCRSLELAQHLTCKGVVDMSIGVEGLIPDDHAVRFAEAFYGQLADGMSVKRAFDLAGLHLGSLDAPARPQLLHAAGVDPAVVVFASPAQ